MLQWRKAALGQLWDTRILEGKQVQVAYEQLIEYKTASVFEASCSLPLIALGKRDLISAGKTYGKSLGMLYQVLDDYADIANNNVDSGSSRLLLMQVKEREGIKRYVKELVSKYFTEIRDASIKLHPSLMDFAVMSMEKFASEAGESVQHILQEVEEKIL